MSARIIIHVRGGVAQVSHASEPVEVLMCDWDCIEVGERGRPQWRTVSPSTPEAFDKELQEIDQQVKEARQP